MTHGYASCGKLQSFVTSSPSQINFMDHLSLVLICFMLKWLMDSFRLKFISLKTIICSSAESSLVNFQQHQTADRKSK